MANLTDPGAQTTPLILRAEPVVTAMKRQLTDETSKFTAKNGRKPKLVVILVGNDPASVIYTSKKGERATEMGMLHATLNFDASVSPNTVQEAVTKLNEDTTVDGILIQRPLPKTFIEEEVLSWIHPDKDVDAFHPVNAGRLSLGLPCFSPCTPQGVMTLLKHYKIDVAGMLACVVGRSSIVGKPMAALLLQNNATVIQAHSRTKDLTSLTKQADLVVVAAGKPELIRAKDIKPGAIVIDVGIHRVADDKSGAPRIVGDVAFEEVARVAKAITPVPGGVGPLTIMTLLTNTLRAAELQVQSFV